MWRTDVEHRAVGARDGEGVEVAVVHLAGHEELLAHPERASLEPLGTGVDEDAAAGIHEHERVAEHVRDLPLDPQTFERLEAADRGVGPGGAEACRQPDDESEAAHGGLAKL